MSENYRHLYGLGKAAVAVLTPEAEQAAVQPPMDPAMAGGAPPMDPMAAGGMPPQAGAGAPPMGGAPMAPPAAGQIPPEILQDQMFIQFLQEALGVSLDSASGMFMGPNGEQIPPQLIIEAYQEFQTMQAQGGMPPAGAGAPPAAGMDPAMAAGGAPMPAGAPPMDPMAAGMPPEAAGGVPPEMGGASEEVPPEMGAAPEAGAPAPVAGPEAMMQELLSGVEAVLQSFSGKLDKQLSAIQDKIEALKMDVESLRDTTDQRTKMEEDEAARIREELEAELVPTAVAQKEASISIPTPQPIKMPTVESKPSARKRTGTPNLFSVIQGGKR